VTDELSMQVGQCIMIGIPQPALDAATAELLRAEAIGNVVLFARNTPEPVTTRALTDALQALAARSLAAPMLIGIDQEGGAVLRLTQGATPVPSAMAIGAADSESDAAAVARVTARELRAVGVNMNLAPVLDVNNNPQNPVIGTRSFGEDPARVAAFGRATIAAYRHEGLAATAKHFPGHGDTSVDSHLALPALAHDRRRLDALELVPFRAAIAEQVEALMVGHLALTAVDPSGAPASQSAAVVDGLLIRELGYQGVVCTDCLEMAGASTGVEAAEAAVRAFEAGADLILISHTPEKQRSAAAALRAACRSGRIPRQRLHRSVAKIAALKERIARAPALPLEIVGSTAHREEVEKVAQRAVTLARNEGMLPLNRGARIGLVSFHAGVLTPVESQPAGDPFLTIARSRGLGEIRALPLDPDPSVISSLQAWARGFEGLLVCTRRATRFAGQIQAARALARVRPTALMALREPYDLGGVPEARAALAAYGDGEPLARAALAVCFGELTPRGRLPVRVPGLGAPL